MRFAAGRRSYLFPTAHYFDGLTKGFDGNLDAVPRFTENERMQGLSFGLATLPIDLGQPCLRHLLLDQRDRISATGASITVRLRQRESGQ
ncbi:hypothetical protein [Bradyrhizobium sp. CSS354]|uniref:hypothetical protein n=1 Tax=Bradyrhizobium sp. CSS354 TaxID=2699172 RepID=UPI0023B0D7BB|nr:hypothetical protein [Bradyrhizobium sp. CSS354]MDE5462380.1 hypothetical protein [Bradyrhizobium sp. CSS354]